MNIPAIPRDWPTGRYAILTADPPWSYRDSANAGKRGAVHKYPVMTTADIGALPVPEIALPDSVLLLWATSPLLPDALRVMEAWGYRYKTVAFVWVKVGQQGQVVSGMGHHTRGNAEYVLLGTRRKGLPRLRKDIAQVLLAPRREHSRKPDEVRTRIEQLYGDVSRVELFARGPLPTGWDGWGNEYLPSAARTVIPSEKV